MGLYNRFKTKNKSKVLPHIQANGNGIINT